MFAGDLFGAPGARAAPERNSRQGCAQGSQARREFSPHLISDYAPGRKSIHPEYRVVANKIDGNYYVATWWIPYGSGGLSGTRISIQSCSQVHYLGPYLKTPTRINTAYRTAAMQDVDTNFGERTF